MTKYQLNLIRTIRINEKKAEAARVRILGLTVFSFGLLAVALMFAVLNVLRMKQTIADEKDKLARIELEYSKYKATRMIVDKADIELLDQLQTRRIFWTKKLAAMAFHLPNQPPNPYWITKFGYKNGNLGVFGYGYISPQQEQLITVDDYLNSLRADSTFCDVFKTCFLKSTVRSDEGAKERVTFEYSSLKAGVALR